MWLLIGILFVAGIIYGSVLIHNAKCNSCLQYNIGLSINFICGFLLFVIVICIGCAIDGQFDGRRDYAWVTSYYDTDMYQAYTEIIQSQLDAGIIGDLSNSTVGNNIIDNIDNWFAGIQRCNALITKTKLMNQSWFFDPFYYDWPEYPKIITQKEIQELKLKFVKNVQNMNVPVVIGR
jgi:hypothetical protein